MGFLNGGVIVLLEVGWDNISYLLGLLVILLGEGDNDSFYVKLGSINF